MAQPARITRGFITFFCLLTHIKALSMLSSSSCFPNTRFSCSVNCTSYLSILHDSGIILLSHSYNHITSHFSSAPKPQLSKPVLLSRLSKPGLPPLAPSPPLAGCCFTVVYLSQCVEAGGIFRRDASHLLSLTSPPSSRTQQPSAELCRAGGPRCELQAPCAHTPCSWP